jgi:hypothetical protein
LSITAFQVGHADTVKDHLLLRRKFVALLREALDELPFPRVKTAAHLKLCEPEPVELAAVNVLWPWQELRG